MTRLGLLHPDWPAPPAVRAAFTLRTGGVSAGAYTALNLGAHVGDDARAVAENRRRVAAELALPAAPLWLSQVHGSAVVEADSLGMCEAGAPAPRADAALTRQPKRVLAVLVADCLPVLLARRDGAAVAVAHAGWRGLAAGVLETTVAALGSAGDELLAWLGPAIGAAQFEVGEEVRTAFCQHDAQAAAAFASNARGRWQCDLHRLARQRLSALGLRSIHGEPRCTYGEAKSFYSFRRDGTTGRMAALIWLDGGGCPP
jgi:polyphenol oxidase